MSTAPLLPIDLAPSNPYSLTLPSPVLPAPGCAVRELDTSQLGGIVTRTATLHTRRGPPPRFAATPAGFVVSELPTIGLRTLLKEEGRRWERSALPVVASLQGDAEELAEMAATLESVEVVSGLLIAAEDDLAVAVAAVRRNSLRPILALLQPGPNLVESARSAVASGADAVVVAAPPRAAAGPDPLVEGYLLGPAVFPLTLQALSELRAALDVPTVALGGIATAQFARAALLAGATAVMVDAARWGNPHAPAQIARALLSTTSDR